MEKKILIVDDDVAIGEMLEELLKKHGYSVFRAVTGEQALMLIGSVSPDLILLDLMLPGICGESLLPHIKSIPTIVVSAKVGIDDKVSTLYGGAVDYVTKPFDTSELLARISVQLRRGGVGGVLSFDGIVLDVSGFSVVVDGTPVKLTRSEYVILSALVKNGGKVVTKERIMEELECVVPDCEENSLRTHIGNLRQKLKLAGGKDRIESVWGIGYKLGS